MLWLDSEEMMKKISLIILLSVLAFSLASCSKTAIPGSPTQEPLQSMRPGSDLSQSNKSNTANPNNNTNTVAGNSTSVNSAGISTTKNNGSTNNFKITASVSITPKPTESIASPEVPKNTVMISITGPSSRGVIVEKSSVDFIDGDTVLDALKSITKQQSIRLDSTSTLPGMDYVKGIDNIYQFDEGGGSGWLYAVNGKSAGISCGSYKLKDGDDIEWRYSLDLGKDIGWNLQ